MTLRLSCSSKKSSCVNSFAGERDEYFQVGPVVVRWQPHGLTRMLLAPVVECEAQAVQKTVDAPQLQCIAEVGEFLGQVGPRS